MKIFSPSPLSDSETALLSQLQTSKPEWQREWIRKNVVSPAQNDAFARIQVPPVPWWRKLADATAKMFKPLSLAPGRMVMAGGAIAVVAFAVLEGPNIAEYTQIKNAQSNVASGFVERRTTEMRFTSMGYAPKNAFPTELGDESGRDLDNMPSLLEAKTAAAKKLRSGKADPQWLQIRGRILLWQSTSSSLENAEKDFEKAKAEGLDSPSLEIDLAASYFERDRRSEHPNLQRTLNLLNEILSKGKLSNQERATALYDLAIAYEKTQAWDLAASTWEDYLKVDSTGDWADDARRHLKDAKSKIQSKREEGYESPSYFLDQHRLEPEDPEQYQQKALSGWLPEAMKDERSIDYQSVSYQAVSKLAKVLEEQQDFWWRDFLKVLRPEDLSAVEELKAAIDDNEKGKYGQAVDHAQEAARVFSRNKNVPGDLRARFEEVYAQRSQIKDCLARAGSLGDELSSTKYRWLQGQLSLEKAQCMKFQGEFAEGDIEAQSSRSIAQNGFPVLELRVLGISASMNHQQGRCNEAWGQATEGLERYWKGAYPRDRLDQFYSVMWQCAEQSGSLYAAETLLQHTLAMHRESKDPSNQFREAMVRFRLRNLFMALGQGALANQENDRAVSLLDDHIPNVRLYRLITEIEPAELQLQQGDAGRALATLDPVSAALTGVQDNFIILNYYRVLGNIYWELRRLDEAGKAYQQAIKIADNAMVGIADDKERISWQRATNESYRGLVRVLLEQKKGQEALKNWEWYQSRPMFQGLRSDGREPAEKFPTKTERKNSTALMPASPDTHLVYASFKDGMQIWVSNSKGVQGKWVSVKQEDFERAVRDFSERCATPESSLKEVHQQGLWLYSQLLQPVISELPQSQVVVVDLDRSANNLSVESLMSPEGWYFGEKYAVLYSPGARMEKSLRMPARVGAQDPMLVLDASHAPGSGYLPGTADQRNAISQLFPRAKIIGSTSVSWAEARSYLTASTVLHYMGHGKPDGSGTSLGYNASQLRAKDFTPDLLKRSQLVVLAACSSGLGKENGLWDANSLVHAFLAAGVPHVVSSHWNVDSEPTSQLMVRFYKNVADNQPVPQAIYEARKEILKNHPHPYYWASFSLTGRVN